MSKKQISEKCAASYAVIKKYMEYVEIHGGDPNHHLARILVGEKIKGKVLEVGVMIGGSQAKVIICGDDEFSRDYHSEYTNIYNIFESYAEGSLIIRDTEDYFGNPVQIELSFYK